MNELHSLNTIELILEYFIPSILLNEQKSQTIEIKLVNIAYPTTRSNSQDLATAVINK